MTEHKIDQLGLPWTEQLHRKLFENSFVMLLLFDEQGAVTKWNLKARAELGYTAEPVSVYVDQIFPKDFTREQGKLARIERDEDESIAYRRNQTCFPVELFIDIGAIDGRFYGYCIAQNVTRYVNAMKDMRKAKYEAKEAVKIRDELVSNVTHELRTPMNGIQGIANQMLETPLNEEQQGMLSTIRRCCGNMTKIINDLLDFAKLNHASFTLEEKEFIFRDFMKETAEVNLPMIREKGLSFRVNIAPDVPKKVIGDGFRIGQILNNLISNSIKFTEFGSIEVNVSKTMELNENRIELFFMVVDTGIGIEQKNMDKLFHSFSQVDASITRRYGGTGLGLSIAKQLVELMDGEIFVESDYQKGSTFSFSIRITGRREEEPPDDLENSFEVLAENLAEKELVSGDSGKNPDQHAGRINRNYFMDAMDKLRLCMEMNNWERAEELGELVKSLLGREEEDGELKKEAFRMLLSIRKEDKAQAWRQYEAVKNRVMEKEANKRN